MTGKIRTARTMSLVALLAASPSALASPRPEGPAGLEQTRFNGSTLYKTYCASCHGESGRGDGAVAIFLRRQPADLTQIAKRNKGIFPADRVFQLIDGRQMVKAHGESQMPVWGDAFSRTTEATSEESIKERIEALVGYLESIQERQTGPGIARPPL